MANDSDFKKGDLIYLTMSCHDWLCRKNQNFSIPFSGRLARIMEIIDWDSEEGARILSARALSGKWGEYKTEDFRYVVEIYLPEIETNGFPTAAPHVLPEEHPIKGGKLFHKVTPGFVDRMLGSTILERYGKAVSDHVSKVPGDSKTKSKRKASGKQGGPVLPSKKKAKS